MGSAEIFMPCAVMLSWFIFVDSKQPQNLQIFKPLKINYPYSISYPITGFVNTSRFATLVVIDHARFFQIKNYPMYSNFIVKLT